MLSNQVGNEKKKVLIYLLYLYACRWGFEYIDCNSQVKG